MTIRKVVIPVAGWGTRSLPASKNVPKEMLPIYNKPAIQYIVEEALHAGLTDVVLVTNREKRIIEDHFDYNLQLETVLERAHKTEMLCKVRAVAEMASVISIRQKRQMGLGHAVLCARDIVKDAPFGVMLGDDLIFGVEAGIGQLCEAMQRFGLPCVGVCEVPRDKVSRYGIVDGEEIAPGVLRVRKLVEKPNIEDAPSNLAIVGRYLLTPDIFSHLDAVRPGKDGEIQLTDALQNLAASRGLLAVTMGGQRYDAGDWVEYLTANIHLALTDKTLHDDLMKKLSALLDSERRDKCVAECG